MNRIAPLLSLPLLLLPAALQAQEVGQDSRGEVSVNGSVAPICVLGTPSQAVIDLGQLIDTSGPRIGRAAAIAPQSVIMPDSFCNYANTTVTVAASALFEQTGAPLGSGFARTVNYRVDVSPWAASDAELVTAAPADGGVEPFTATSSSQPLPRMADLVMRLSSFSAPADSLLVAGSYAGQITVTLGPADVSAN